MSFGDTSRGDERTELRHFRSARTHHFPGDRDNRLTLRAIIGVTVEESLVGCARALVRYRVRVFINAGVFRIIVKSPIGLRIEHVGYREKRCPRNFWVNSKSSSV